MHEGTKGLKKRDVRRGGSVESRLVGHNVTALAATQLRPTSQQPAHSNTYLPLPTKKAKISPLPPPVHAITHIPPPPRPLPHRGCPHSHGKPPHLDSPSRPHRDTPRLSSLPPREPPP